MKKIILFLLVLAAVLSMTACSDERSFESEEALINCLEGVWVLNGSTYYVFHDGRAYTFTNSQFCDKVESLLSYRLDRIDPATAGVSDYLALLEHPKLDDILTQRRSLSIDSKKGTVLLEEGSYNAEQILVTNASVYVKNINTSERYPLKQCSVSVDFSIEPFTTLFNKTAEDFVIPCSDLVYNATEYAEALRSAHPDAKNWPFVHKTSDGSTTYGYLNGPNNLTISTSKEMLIYSMGTNKGFYIMYNPSGVLGQDYHLLISDDLSTPLSTLLDNATILLKNLPGALSTPEIVTLFTQQHEVLGESLVLDKTENGFRYKISKSVSGQHTRIWITLPEPFGLKPFLDHIAKKQVCSVCNCNALEVPFTSSDSLCDNCYTSSAEATLALDISKVWKMETHFSDYTVIFHYAFSEDGTCHLLLSDESFPYAGGKGTYQINGDTISFSMVVDGEEYEYSYTYDPKTSELTFSSGTPVFSELALPGAKYPLQEDTINSTEKITELAEAYLDGYDGDHG